MGAGVAVDDEALELFIGIGIGVVKHNERIQSE